MTPALSFPKRLKSFTSMATAQTRESSPNVLARDNGFPSVAAPPQKKQTSCPTDALGRSDLVRFPLSSGCCNTFPSAGFLFLSSLFNLVALYLTRHDLRHEALCFKSVSAIPSPSLSQTEVLQPHKNSPNPFDV